MVINYMVCLSHKISRLMFQIRAKTNTHCASYIVDEVIADRTDKLENGCQFSVYSKLKG